MAGVLAASRDAGAELVFGDNAAAIVLLASSTVDDGDVNLEKVGGKRSATFGGSTPDEKSIRVRLKEGYKGSRRVKVIEG